MNGEQRFKQWLKQLKVESVCAIGFGVRRVVVYFEKKPIDSGCDSGSSQQRNILRLAAAHAIGRRRLLHRMRSIKDDGSHLAHYRERAEIDDERVVAEAGAALGEKDA